MDATIEGNGSESTDEKQRPAHLFQRGVSGNPAGRPLSAKNKIPERFYRLVSEILEEDDEAARASLRRLRDAPVPKDFWTLIQRVEDKRVNLDVSGKVEVVSKIQRYIDAWEYVATTPPRLLESETIE
jgi:hypothetical protein